MKIGTLHDVLIRMLGELKEYTIRIVVAWVNLIIY